LAVSIAQQELLELLGLAPNVYEAPEVAGSASQSTNASAASIIANVQPSVAGLSETA